MDMNALQQKSVLVPFILFATEMWNHICKYRKYRVEYDTLLISDIIYKGVL